MRTLVLALPFAAASLLGTSAQAATFTLSPGTAGLTFEIQNQGLVTDLYEADGTSDTYAILLTLTTNTDYVDAGSPDVLAAFSVDFAAAALDGADLVSSPTGYSWTPALVSNKVPGGSAKCNGNEAGSLCVEEVPSETGNLVLDANGQYSWLFHIDFGAGGLGDATSLVIAIGTLKTTGPITNLAYSFQGESAVTGLTGALGLPALREPGPDTAPVPEPTSLVLLGSGLLFAASRMRRGKQ